jgi:predicted RNase H-like HicB family nuclease
MQYLVVIEEGESGFGAYVPDLPGCIAAAASRDEVVTLIQEAIEFHIEGLRGQGDVVPRPTSTAQVVEVSAA